MWEPSDQTFKPMKPDSIALCLALLTFPPSMDAAVFAREDFNYTNGSLAGNNGGLGWIGPWNNAQGTPTVAASKGVVNSVAGQQGARLISGLQTPPTGGTKSVWLSFEGQQNTNVAGTVTTGSYGGLGLFLGGTEQLLIGKAWGGDYQWKAGTGDGLVGPATPVSTLDKTIIIARVTMVDAANDTLDVWLNPADTSSVAALGPPQITRTDPDLSFDTLRIRGGTGDAAITTEGWTFDAIAAGDNLADVVASDSDGDGMLDAWENANNLVVGVNDAAGDGDGDGSPNLQEFQRSTDPNNADSDSDNLKDGVETGTGIYVSPSNTGTSPTLADTDGDGFYDDEENNSGTFMSETNPGTDPNKADTDGDTHFDMFEVTRGSNPTLATSVPATGDLALVGSDDFSTYADGAVVDQAGGNGFNFDNSLTNNAFVGHNPGVTSDWDFITSAPTFSGGRLFTQENGAKREFNGPGEGIIVNGDEYTGAVKEDSAAKAVYFRADLTRANGATWSGISSYDFGAERLFFGVTSGVGPSGFPEFAIEESGVGTTFNTSTPALAVAGQTYTLVAKLDFAADLLSLWVNPDLTKAEVENTPHVTRAYTGGNWCTAVRLASGGSAATAWDHVVVAREWSAVGTFPGVQANTYGVWIGGYPQAGGAQGFDQDADHDGIANGVEHVLGTDPTLPTLGLREVATTPGALVFRHSRRNSLATDVSYVYEWSTDLQNWAADGATSGGVTVTTTPSVVTPGSPNSEVEVSAAVTGPADKVFLRIKATQTVP